MNELNEVSIHKNFGRYCYVILNDYTCLKGMKTLSKAENITTWCTVIIIITVLFFIFQQLIHRALYSALSLNFHFYYFWISHPVPAVAALACAKTTSAGL